jgi:PAS domain S-box-containing protein
MLVLDFQGHIQQINRQARVFLGNPAQVAGVAFSSFLKPDEQRTFGANLEQLRTGAVTQLEGEQSFTSPQGDTHYILWSMALLDAANPQSGYIISGQDISLRRQAEQALQRFNHELEQRIEERTQELRNSEAMFRAITLGAQDGIMLLNPIQAIVLANEAAEDILGYHPEALLGRSFFHILADENTVLSCERDEPQRLHEVWVQHAQGHIFPIEMTLSPFRLQEEEYIVAILRDISERKQMAEAIAQAHDQLAAQVEQLQELINDKSEFLSIASHDLKNPLGVVAGVGRLLQRKASDLKPEDAQQYGEMVQRAAEKMLAIVVNLLDVQRLEEGQIQLQSAPFEVLALGQEIAATYAHALADKGQRLILEIPPEQTLCSDRHIVGQILENLISNGMKYAPPNTVMTMRSSGNDPIEVQISDQGPGFSAADRTRLFQKFARLSARPTGDEHSTGLGLAIVKRLTLLLGGDITLSESASTGACFILKLPQQPLNKA